MCPPLARAVRQRSPSGAHPPSRPCRRPHRRRVLVDRHDPGSTRAGDGHRHGRRSARGRLQLQGRPAAGMAREREGASLRAGTSPSRRHVPRGSTRAVVHEAPGPCDGRHAALVLPATPHVVCRGLHAHSPAAGLAALPPLRHAAGRFWVLSTRKASASCTALLGRHPPALESPPSGRAVDTQGMAAIRTISLGILPRFAWPASAGSCKPAFRAGG